MIDINTLRKLIHDDTKLRDVAERLRSEIDDYFPRSGALEGCENAIIAYEGARELLEEAAVEALPGLLDKIDKLHIENSALRGELDSFLPAMDGGQSASSEALATNAWLRVEVARLREALIRAACGSAGGLSCWCPSPTYAKRHGGNDHSPNCMCLREVLAKTEPKP